MCPLKSGVLLSAHGTVESLDQLPAFLAKIRRGRPTPPELLEETRRRYELIGGSPMLKITRRVGELLAGALGLPVFVGMRLADPPLSQALAEARQAGVERILSLPLAPQSVHIYHAALREAAAAAPGSPEILEAPEWGLEPALIDAFVESIHEGFERLGGDAAEAALVLSAHSLPLRVIASGDPYEQQFRAMAGAIAGRFPGRAVKIAFQSQGYDGGEWLGPDLKATFAGLRAEGKTTVLVAAVGFLSDHVETLYDLDHEAVSLAAAAGLRYARAPSLNTRPRFIDALAAVARRQLG